MTDAQLRAENRRKRLREWIDREHKGKVLRFANAIKRDQPQIHDVLKGKKSFGEKLARSLEKEAGMPELYLEGKEAPSAASTLFGIKVTRSGVMLAAILDGLDLDDRIEIENTIHAAAAKKGRKPRQPDDNQRPDDDE